MACEKQERGVEACGVRRSGMILQTLSTHTSIRAHIGSKTRSLLKRRNEAMRNKNQDTTRSYGRLTAKATLSLTFFLFPSLTNALESSQVHHPVRR